MKITRRQLKRIIQEELSEARLPAWERPGYVPEEEEGGDKPSATSAIEWTLANSLAHQLLLTLSRSGGVRTNAASFLLEIFNELGDASARASLQTMLAEKQKETNGSFLERR